MKYPLLLLIGAAVLGCSVLTASPTETIGHWRFDTPAHLGRDSSGHDRHLKPEGVSPPSAHLPERLPQPHAASLAKQERQFFTRPVDAGFTFQSFTIEAFVELRSFNGRNPAIIASHFDIAETSGAMANANWQLNQAAARRRGCGLYRSMWRAGTGREAG